MIEKKRRTSAFIKCDLSQENEANRQIQKKNGQNILNLNS